MKLHLRATTKKTAAASYLIKPVSAFTAEDLTAVAENSGYTEDAYRDVEKFQQYLLAHSLREEALMSHLNYPKLLHHLHCHGELLRLAKDFIPSLLVGSNPETLRQKINEMAQLLILHIQIEDGDFAIWKANQEINTPLA